MPKEKEWEEIALSYTLAVFKIGCDSTNYKILEVLPAKTIELPKRLGIPRVSFYVRLNKLAGVGLIDYAKRTTKIDRTELTDKFLGIVDTMQGLVNQNIPKYLLKKVR